MRYPRRIKIVGSIPHPELLEKFISENKKITILTNKSESILGLNNWIQYIVDAIGVVYLSSTDTFEIIHELKTICKVFPEVNLTIHIGVLWSKDVCKESILVNEGKIKILGPAIGRIPRVGSSQISNNLSKDLDKIQKH